MNGFGLSPGNNNHNHTVFFPGGDTNGMYPNPDQQLEEWDQLTFQNTDLFSQINHVLNVQDNHLLAKSTHLENLKDSLLDLEAFTQNAHRKLTLHTKMKAEMSEKSYDHHPLHQFHKDLLAEVETKCQELTQAIEDIEIGDPKVCNSLIQEGTVLKQRTDLNTHLNELSQNHVGNVIELYQEQNLKLFTRIGVLERHTIPHIRSTRDKLINIDLPRVQTQQSDKQSKLAELQANLSVNMNDNATLREKISLLEEDTTKVTENNQVVQAETQNYQQLVQICEQFHDQAKPLSESVRTIQEKLFTSQNNINELQNQVDQTKATLPKLISQLESQLEQESLTSQHLSSEKAQYELFLNQPALSTLQVGFKKTY